MDNFTNEDNSTEAAPLQTAGDVAIELMFLAEGADGDAALLVGDALNKNVSVKERREICEALLTIGIDQLGKEVAALRGDEVIEISKDPSHGELTFAARFLMHGQGEASVLVYFGGKANPKTPLKVGLVHAMEAMQILSQQL